MNYFKRTFRSNTARYYKPTKTRIDNNNYTWCQPLDTSDNIIGINDSSYYTFRDSRYEGLAREILQNSLDEQLDKTKPVKVEFSLVEINTKDIPDFNNFKSLYEDGYKSWEKDSQDNAKIFFDSALKALSGDKIKVMRISDFNTNGVLGSQTTQIRSAKDITPWYDLLKSEGSSSKGGTQGGSFGIGKNATFANSVLRTVIYSTYDKQGIKGYEGVAKLATVFKENKRYSSKCYYGNIKDGKSIAIEGLLPFPNYTRDEYGTDIYVLGFEEDDFWKIRMIKSILSDFIIPIHNKNLEVDMNGEIIEKNTLGQLYDKYIDFCNNNRNKSVANEFLSAKNYYEILTSEDTLEFTHEFIHESEKLGEAQLKVLYNPDFERKILRTRDTGMKLFDYGGVSSTIGFSAIVSLKGEKLNKLFREMENPAHTKWSADNISNPERRKLGENLRAELNKWMKKEIIENAADMETESLEVEGLEEYLPANLVNDSENKENSDSENISSNISNVTMTTTSREEEKKKKYNDDIEATRGKPDVGGEPGEAGDPKDKDTKNKGGQRRGNNTNVGEGSELVFKKVSNNIFTPRLVKQSNSHRLIVYFKKVIENTKLKVYISGENSNIEPKIKSASNARTNGVYMIKKNEIYIGNVNENEKLTMNLELKDNNNYSLEVEIYEGKQK